MKAPSVVDEYNNDFDTEIPSGMPKPAFWRCFIMPLRPPEKKGSIILPDEAKEAVEYAQFVGKLAAVGDLCFKRKEFDGGTVPKVGDIVMFSRHAPMRFTFNGVRFVVVHDQEIHAIIPPGADLAQFKVYI